MLFKIEQPVMWNSYKHGTLAFHMKDKLKSHALCFEENQNLIFDSNKHKLPSTTAKGKIPTFTMLLKKVICKNN